MFHLLLQKALAFAQFYDETKDASLLTNCESVPQYKDMLRVFQKFTLKDLLLEDSTIKESFIPDTICAATAVESPLISVGYFFIPAGMKLSLHDHPGMLVTSKILKGEIQRRAFDLVDREKQFELPITPIVDIEENLYSEIKLDAVLESQEVFEEGELINLTPISGNIHSFVAVQDTIIIDILTPYYDQETRFCNFYIEADNTKTKPTKKLKKETSETDKFQKGYKTCLIYLSEPPRIPFKIIGCSDALIKGSTSPRSSQ